jgi:hypothetical protein
LGCDHDYYERYWSAFSREEKIMGFLGAILPAAIGGISGLIGNAKTNSANRAAASDSNEFTERQLKNRHQWEVEDLRKAGLNPMLSAGGTPGIGGSAQASVTPYEPGKHAADAVSSAMNYKLANQNLEVLEKDATKKQSETFKTDTENALNVQAFKFNKEMNKILLNSAKTTAALNALQLPAAQNEARFQSDVGKSAPWLRNSLNAIKDILGAGNSAKNLFTSPKGLTINNH